MTTRNFRVHNGISVGDIVIDAATNKITGGATAAPSADGDYSNKKYVDDQDALIASDTLTFTNKTIDANGTGNNITNIDIANMTAASVVLESEGIASNDNDTTLPTSAAVKDYVDTQLTGSDLDFQGDSGGALSIDLDSETLDIAGGTGIDTSGSSNTLTVAIDSTVATASSTHTLTNKTIDANGTGNNISNIEVDDFAAAAIINVSETLAGNDSDTALVTAGAIIDYVDAHDANIASDTLTFTNKTLDANGTGNTITNIDIGNMTAASIVLESEGIASNDNDTTLPTSAAVLDYVTTSLGALSSTSITQLNTSVTVSDSGTNGAITIAADGNTELVINDTSATFSGNVVVTGNLNVNGTTTTLATTNTTVADNIMELNSGISASSNDIGFIFERGSTGNNAAIIWDESADKFTMGLTTATAGDKSGGISLSGVSTLVANLEGNVTGAVTGNADTASALASAVTIGGVSFDGSGAINLPGVNQAGNQNTSGTAAVATAVTAADESTDTACNVLFVTAATGDLPPKTGTNLTFNSSSGNLTAPTFTGNLTGTATAAEYSDVAERFASDTAYEPGTVVALGGAEEITQVNEEGSDEVFGVISSLQQAAFKMNGGAGNDATHPYIAMTGRVNVKVIGSVSKGDRLISASVPGYAKAAIKSECTAFNVIGRALTSKTEVGQGTVLAAVRVSH